MARRTVSAKTIRSIAPIVVPLVTRVALPIVVESMKKGKLQTDGVLDDLQKTAKKSRSDFDDVREEAISRGVKLMDEAKKHGTELLDMLAARGVDVAQDWADALRPKRRRFGWGKALLLLTVVGVGLYAFNRYAD
jgi:hypothetical protein